MKAELNRRRIGFKTEAQRVAEETEMNNHTEVVKISENETSRVIAISPAQANLILGISQIFDIIIGPEFVKFSDEKKAMMVDELMNSVALNTELTLKNNMLLQ